LVAGNARAPYSGLRVGAAGLVDDGRLVVGCNVENASYGLSVCAEVGMVAALAAGGSGRLVAVAVQARDAVLTPCGRCRQVLLEHATRQCLVDTGAGPRLLTELLPDAFGVADL
jgi:cytidine deaminase